MRTKQVDESEDIGDHTLNDSHAMPPNTYTIPQRSSSQAPSVTNKETPSSGSTVRDDHEDFRAQDGEDAMPSFGRKSDYSQPPSSGTLALILGRPQPRLDPDGTQPREPGH